MSRQTTLLTSHKGVDLHAASAVRVMRERLTGGGHLAALYRCELHTYWDEPAGVAMERLLDNGRYFNPNKHHYGHFVCEVAAPWPTASLTDPERDLEPVWPGDLVATDLIALAGNTAALYARLLGGEVPDGQTAVDVVAWSRDQNGPVVSGVLWRLLVTVPPDEAAALGEQLAVARSRKDGLLVNPHMDLWRSVVR